MPSSRGLVSCQAYVCGLARYIEALPFCWFLGQAVLGSACAFAGRPCWRLQVCDVYAAPRPDQGPQRQ